MNSLEQAEDLKAFERRLTEYIHCLQPATGRWRMLLIVVSVCTATGAWNWLIDPETQKVSFFTSLWNHPFFTISCITLIGLFFAGIHKRVVAPSIIAARCRTVLAEYNMSCDDVSIVYVKKLQICVRGLNGFGLSKTDINIDCQLARVNGGNILYSTDPKIHIYVSEIEMRLIICGVVQFSLFL
uniref:Nuclear envelope phosphatase-regulatory subunit 1 n=2 Tax=Felis catus TaxID=9685 RepID=A0ABI7W6F8_FELCA